MYNLKLVNYFDVWGNKKDGYEVNNMCVECDDLYLNNIDNKNILQLLKTIYFLQPKTRINQVIIENDGTMIEVYQKNGKHYPLPLCRLEVIRKV